jgi:hypothetical protein
VCLPEVNFSSNAVPHFLCTRGVGKHPKKTVYATSVMCPLLYLSCPEGSRSVPGRTASPIAHADAWVEASRRRIHPLSTTGGFSEVVLHTLKPLRQP